MGSTQLFQTTGADEQWEAVVLPWLKRESEEAWRDTRPTVILTPSRAESFYLRGRFAGEGLSFLGLRFWTPSDARTFLHGALAPETAVAGEAESRLIARVCAKEVAESSDEPSLASVERDPGLFLRAYDLLLGAGWNPAKDGPAYSRKLARKMEQFLKEHGLVTQSGLHRMLRREIEDQPNACLRSVLIAGFNAAHWPLWDLVRALANAAESATVSLLSPREFAAKVDELWIGSWEEEAGVTVAYPSPDKAQAPQPFAGWAQAYESGEKFDASRCAFSFLATGDLASQVRAIVLQTLRYLGKESCERLGILFPENNALALGVAQELLRLEIPLDDGTGYLRPGLFEKRSWPAWLSLQEEPSVERLIEWLRATEAEGLAFGASLTAREIAEMLEGALGETLIDNLNFLALHLAETSDRRRGREVAEFLQARIQLPESGTFPEFINLTRQAMEQLGWKQHLPAGLADSAACLRDASWSLSRRTFLEWLKDSTDSQERERGAESNHFYGKVHLSIYAQMPGQTWTHLIMTGLNEGRWPRLSEAGAFGSRHELTELNRQARTLNRRGTGQGSQGEGHEAVRPDRGYCLLPMERQDLALRDLCAAVEATSEAICFTAMTSEAGRTLLPSDFFAAAYEAKTGSGLDEAGFASLSKRTTDWSRAHDAVLSEPSDRSTSSADITATQIAYAARRDADAAFGPYEFAYALPPQEPIQLACKTWEKAWNHPAAVWLEEIVGVDPWPEGQLAWPRAVGTWVHRWITSALSTCHEMGEIANFIPLLRTAADRERQRVREQMERAGVSAYPWWNHVWGQARAIALGIGESLAPQLEGQVIFTEYPLPKPGFIALPGSTKADFELRGKIDLLLAEQGGIAFRPASGNFEDCTCWIIDFKTGAAKNLTPSRMEKGMGLQTMLYALAIRARGAASIAVSLHTADATLKPQVQVEQIEANFALFRSLDRLHRSGVFGMRPGPENEYGFAPEYPMATRPIAAPILEAKWALAHGAGDWWEES